MPQFTHSFNMHAMDLDAKVVKSLLQQQARFFLQAQQNTKSANDQLMMQIIQEAKSELMVQIVKSQEVARLSRKRKRTSQDFTHPVART